MAIYSTLPSRSRPFGPSASPEGGPSPEGSPSIKVLRVPLALITEIRPVLGVLPTSAASRLPAGPVMILEGFNSPLEKTVACCADPGPAARPNRELIVKRYLSVDRISADCIMEARIDPTQQHRRAYNRHGKASYRVSR